MPIAKNPGRCLLCNQTVEHRAVTKHLAQCLEKNTQQQKPQAPEKEKIFLIKITAGKEFWLYIEMNGSATLETLDDFLRETWLECCGHLSEFIINGNGFSSDGNINMKKPIHKVLPINTEFDYEYDFGSTTHLQGKVLSARAGKLPEGVRLLARNHLPENIQCKVCQKKPDVICTSCYDFYCAKCRKKHASNCDGEDYLLPVVNSPRMGVCGYTGHDV